MSFIVQSKEEETSDESSASRCQIDALQTFSQAELDHLGRELGLSKRAHELLTPRLKNVRDRFKNYKE